MPQTLTSEIGEPSTESWRVLSTSTDYTISYGGTVVLVDATSGDITIDLPPAANNVDRMIVVKKTDASANSVIIDADGSEEIDGDTTVSITTENAAVMMISNGSEWKIL